MTTIDMPVGAPTIGASPAEPGTTTAGSSNPQLDVRGKAQSGPPVLLVAAYFLGLASVAVIAVGGHFPWFTVAPATVLTLIAYFRHVEATLERKTSG